MNWDQYKNEFIKDGSLRDLYIENTTIEDWDMFLSLINTQTWSVAFFADSICAPIPKSAKEIFINTINKTLNINIKINAINIACHFFTVDEIELDIDTREINTEADANIIFEFMKCLSNAINKRVILTPENYKEEIIFEITKQGIIKYNKEMGHPTTASS